MEPYVWMTISADRRKQSVPNHIDNPLSANARIARAGEARRGWTFERLKESEANGVLII